MIIHCVLLHKNTTESLKLASNNQSQFGQVSSLNLFKRWNKNLLKWCVILLALNAKNYKGINTSCILIFTLICVTKWDKKFLHYEE